MQTPLFVRPLTADERATLETGLRSASAFTVRRCQILLASAEQHPTPTIARELRCTDQTVRNTIHAFHQRGLAVLQPRSSRPHATATIFDAETCEALWALLPHSPRTFGKPASRWTLALAPRSQVLGRRATTPTGRLWEVPTYTLSAGILLTKMYFLLLNQTLLATVACLIALSDGAITVGKARCSQGVCVMKCPVPLPVRITLAWHSRRDETDRQSGGLDAGFWATTGNDDPVEGVGACTMN